MLHFLEVRDFGHIARAQLDLPDSGFCVITGETGMGKSMLIDALALALGNRVARKPVRSGAKQAEICAAFHLPEHSEAERVLVEHSLPADDGELVIRRLIDVNSRSKNYINGKLVNVTQLQEVVAGIISICGQHEHLQLARPERRRQLLDAAADADAVSADVASCYSQLQSRQQQLDKLLKQEEKSAEQVAQLQEQLAEIDQAQISVEQLNANEAIAVLRANAEELGGLANEVADNCAQITRQATQACQSAERMTQIDNRYRHGAQLLAEVQALSEELSREINKVNSDLSLPDPQTAQDAESYMAEAHRLARKYNLVSPLALVDHALKLRKELAEHAMQDVPACRQSVAVARQKWLKQAQRLTKLRTKEAKLLSMRVAATLTELGMVKARFDVALKPEAQPCGHGQEDVEFKFASTAKTPLGELAASASGGELSRAFLALFANVKNDDGKDLIFDEVDVGVGGKVAAQVGSLLARLGDNRLVMCVTHLPQVAAAALHHWQASVDANGNGIFIPVEDEAREREIARMLAGRKVTQASLANARDIMAAAV